MNTSRYHFLDMLRGLAIAGILLVNAYDIVRLGSAVTGSPAGRAALDYGVQSRFVPIFAVLFGVSMWLIVDGARRRGDAVGGALVLRMIAIGAIGVAHSFFYDGDILREYAIVGLLAIPAVLWLSPWLSLTIGAALTAVSFGFLGGGVESVPGLVLLGIGAAGAGLPALLERGGRALWVAVGLLVPIVAVLTWQHVQVGGGDPRFSIEGTRAGLATAALYVIVAAVIWQWGPARRVLSACFISLGRTSLSSYVGANVIVVGLAKGFDFTHAESVWPLLGLCALVLFAQAVAATIWLHYFTNGPLEWVLRAITWRTVPKLRRVGAHRAGRRIAADQQIPALHPVEFVR
ncbi:DUF418 domain-containing protein [Gordonia phthalatica]|uniref:DUF418 domain-containing protein n=1 Tax=Gordonia phthalatica TaxID=1136941 RepID=A0A0N9N963_9ACTN|nr:DUF418 domain-containing protein [Gordonia phthalatica]ALG83529.1 hypothetical protein ACH46_02155 [Gordonia phthalatica]